MPTEDASLEKLAGRLEATGKYRVLRKLVPRPILPEPSGDHRVALIVDTETTGLDPTRDEVVELGLLAFAYSPEGQIGPVIARYEGLREPNIRMSEEAITITGILPEDLIGQELDDDVISRLVERSDILIAHNAAFDRPMCERLLPAFKSKPWACSATEVPWKKFGFDGVKLTYLVTQTGLFNNGHRALDDCNSLLEVLDQKLDDATTALSALLNSARETRFVIWVQAPFDARETLRLRGYRWNPGGSGRLRGWWIEGDRQTTENELAFIQEHGLGGESVLVERRTAYDRYKLVSGVLPRA